MDSGADKINTSETGFGETFRFSPIRSAQNVMRTGASLLGLDPAYRKVFAVGLSKTATTSIHQVFVDCGLHAIHGMRGRRLRRPFAAWQWQAMSDQIAHRFVRLDKAFPRSLFILNTRDLDEWMDSRLQHIALAVKEGRATRGDWRPEDDAVISSIRARQLHHLAVLNYFRHRSQDLLVLNYVRDPLAADKIAEFIGREPPPQKPHLRSTGKLREAGRLENADQIARCLKSIEIPSSEWRNDLLCPSLGGTDGFPVDTSQPMPRTEVSASA